jgi:hypothetical protein
MARYREQPKDLVSYTGALDKRVGRLERLPRAVATSVDSGSLTITNGTLQVVPNGLPETYPTLLANTQGGVPQVAMIRNNIGAIAAGVPTHAFIFYDGGGGFGPDGTINIYDRAGLGSGAIVADANNEEARGLSAPQFHVHFFDSSLVKTTTSGSFVNIMSTFWYMYHPHLRVRVIVQTPAGTTGEVRVKENSQAQQAIFSIPSNANQFVDLIVDRRNCFYGTFPNGDDANLDLEFRRTGGAGSVSVIFVEAIAIDLSFLW